MEKPKINALTSYLAYKKMFELLSKKNYTIKELKKLSDISISTLYKMIDTGIKNNVILITSYKINDSGRKERIFTINPEAIQEYLI